MRVLRVYHGGRSPGHRARERTLVSAGVDVTLVVPARWAEPDAEAALSQEEFPIVELPVRRPDDVNRHAYTNSQALASVVRDIAPDLLDVYEEPFSVAARQWLAVSPPSLPAVMYTAQNVDKRFPPPFSQYEKAALRRVSALYPCSKQAASVARGKGFAGLIEVLPLGYDDALFHPGAQSLEDDEVVLGLFGRLVPEKGVQDAVDVLARACSVRPARLIVVGHGSESEVARARAAALGLADRVELLRWQPAAELAETYRRAHVVLVPSRPTTTWVEQFGRVIVEGQASGAVVAGYASGTIPEVAGAPAILTAVGDVAKLGDRIAALLAEPSEFERRRTWGIELSRDRTWERVTSRHVELYRRVVASDIPRLELPPSPRRRRRLARNEFGPTAATPAGVRPFALPLLRRGGPVPEMLAWAVDVASELRARLPGRLLTGHDDKISR